MSVSMEGAEEGRRYRVRWDDCCASGNFEAVLERKDYVPDPPEPEPFLESLTFANGVTISGRGVGLEEVAEDPLGDEEWAAAMRALGTRIPAAVLTDLDRLHPPDSYGKCAAHDEGQRCCTDLLLTVRRQAESGG